MIMGTAAYMSPEQARGKPLDKRTDIWAFGCVLYEMLTGQRPFDGETVSDILAAIIRADPDLDVLPPGTSSGTARLIERCLRKDPRQRLRDAGDARLELEESDEPATLPHGALPAPQPGLVALPWALAVLGLAVAGVTLMMSGAREDSPRELRPIIRTEIRLPAEAPLAPASEFINSVPVRGFELARDGSRLVYVALVDGARELWIRDMATGVANRLSGTAGAEWPFFSPDGESVAFFADGKLKTMEVSGGGFLELADVVWGYGGYWADDAWIYFAPSEGAGILRVRADGASQAVEEVTPPPSGIVWGHTAPILMPSKDALLLTADSLTTPFVEVVRLADPSASQRLAAGMGARYAPSGHLVWGGLGGQLMAAPFDTEGLQIRSAPAVIFDDVEVGSNALHASWSDTGTLVYVPGGDLQIATFEWIDRRGTRTPLGLPEARYGAFALSPDGAKVVFMIKDGNDSELWLHDFAAAAPLPLSREPVNDVPIWGPDGKTVFFSRIRDGRFEILSLDIDQPDAAPEQIMVSEEYVEAYAVTDEGMVYEQGLRLHFAPFEEDSRKLRQEDGGQVVDTDAIALFARLSPDEEWLVYTSAETGRWEIQLVRFPEGTDKRRLSADGGEEPRWNPRGGEIIYRNGTRWYSVPFDGTSGAATPRPAPVFEGPFINVGGYSWDIAPDGERFLVLTNPDINKPVTRLVVVSNFFDELERRVPAR